jgi:hypothetical protein
MSVNTANNNSLDGVSGMRATVSGSTAVSNHAVGIRVGNGTVSGNVAMSNGAGIFCDGFGRAGSFFCVVSENTVVFNTTPNGIFVASCPSVVLGNTAVGNGTITAGNLQIPGSGCALANNATP